MNEMGDVVSVRPKRWGLSAEIIQTIQREEKYLFVD